MKYIFTALVIAAAPTNARNIVITADSIAVATSANGGRTLVTYDAVNSNEISHQFDELPSSIRGFDDVLST